MPAAEPDLLAAVTAALEEALPALAAAVAAKLALHAPEPSLQEDQGGAEQQLRELLSEHPRRNAGDLDRWLVAAARVDGVVNALRWAWDSGCPTQWWARQARLPAAAADRGRGRPGRCELEQLVAEHALSRNPARVPDVAALDEACAAVLELIRTHAAAQAPTITHAWRRNMLELFAHTGSRELTVDIIRWCLQNRPHWQRAIRRPPSIATFRKMRDDYRHAGQEWSSNEIPPQLAGAVATLTSGWHHYMRQLAGHECTFTSRTERNLLRALTGEPGWPAVAEADLQQLIKWWLADGNFRFVPFHDRCRDDFPEPSTVKGSLVSMRAAATAVSASVVATNNAAADHRASSVAELRGLA